MAGQLTQVRHHAQILRLAPERNRTRERDGSDRGGADVRGGGLDSGHNSDTKLDSNLDMNEGCPEWVELRHRLSGSPWLHRAKKAAGDA